MKVGAGILAGAVLIVAAFLAGRSFVDSPEQPAAPSTTATSAASRLVEFRDEKAGWAISYPNGWNRLQPKEDAEVTLVVSEKPAEQNTGGSILARDLTLAAPVSDANLAAAKEVTDRVVSGDGIKHITEPTVIHHAGLPGYFYFYSFKDSASDQEGVHSHYFLFKGSTMISFVLQALPKDDFRRLANLYDEVISSFRVL